MLVDDLLSRLWVFPAMVHNICCRLGRVRWTVAPLMAVWLAPPFETYSVAVWLSPPSTGLLERIRLGWQPRLCGFPRLGCSIGWLQYLCGIPLVLELGVRRIDIPPPRFLLRRRYLTAKTLPANILSTVVTCPSGVVFDRPLVCRFEKGSVEGTQVTSCAFVKIPDTAVTELLTFAQQARPSPQCLWLLLDSLIPQGLFSRTPMGLL